MLSVKNLTKVFSRSSRLFGSKKSDFVAVDNISFTIGQGEIVGILGPNGAGKTTTIKMLLDLLTPTAGTIEYFDLPLHKYRSQILQQVSYASTYTKLPGNLTVWENLYVYGRLYLLQKRELTSRIDKYLELFGMQDRKDQEMGTLSAGQTTRVMLAKAFLVQPKIVLLDEPTAALDPDIAQDVRAFILEQQKEFGMSVLLASHNMDEVSALCNRVIVMSKGKIIADDTPQTLARTVSRAHITLTVLDGLKRIVAHCEQHNLVHKVTDRVIEIWVDEEHISMLLATFGKADINYSHISIDKPTLEDYFLEIARNRHTPKEVV